MARKAKLFTIGYEQTPHKAVLDELEAAGVRLLVDVRGMFRTLPFAYGLEAFFAAAMERQS